jgi:hypothetical protein
MRSKIVDQFGRPLAYDFYQSGNRNVRREHPWRYYNAAYDTDTLLPTSSWSQLISSSRFLFANVPIVRGSVLEQANFSFPIEPRFVGKDKDWSKPALEWIYEWYKDCNVRGRPYNQHTNSRLRMIGRKVDGDIGSILTIDSDGLPRTQFVRAHRIGSREDLDKGLRKKSPYKNARECNGIISDDRNRPIAYHILGDNADEDQFIPANSMVLTYRPAEPDQTRGIPELCASIRSFSDIKRLREYEMRAQQLCASIAMLEKNETGTIDEAELALTGSRPESGTDATGTPSGLVEKTYGEGMIMYFKANSGSGLEAFRSSRPAADAQAWEDKIVTQALYGSEWDPNFALAIKEPGGAWARTVIQKIVRCIGNNVSIEADAQKIEVVFALAVAIEAGVLPAPKTVSDLMSWEFALAIPLITADSGNDEAAAREAYKLGLTTLQAICGPKGSWWTELREQRHEEVVDLLKRAKTIKELYPELSMQECINLLEQRTPNATGPASPEKDTSSKTPQADPENEAN